MSLQTRLIVGVVLLIVLCMGAAILAAGVYGRRVAEESIEKALSQSQLAQARFVQLQIDQLEIQARWFSRDPAIVSYFLEGVDTNNTVSLLDLLAEYQQEVDFNLALVLDADGFLVVRTDRPEAEAVDMAEEPLVELAFDEGSASGFWLDSGVLYTAVAVPLTQQFDLIGYLIMAQRLDQELAAEVKRVTSADIAYLVAVDGGLQMAATTLNGPQESRLIMQVRSLGGLPSVLQQDGSLELVLGDEPFEGLAAPLRDANNGRLGATVALTSKRERTADLARLLRVLWAVGLASLLLGVGLAFVLSRRVLQPVRSLADAAEAAKEGDYDVDFLASGSDEVGRLSRSFEGLLTQLRAEQELKTFVGQVSKNLPDPGETAGTGSGPATNVAEVAVGAVDLRGSLADVGMDDEVALASRLEADVRSVHQYCSAHGGQLQCILGLRLYVTFEGPAAPARALVAISDALEALAGATSAFHEPRPAMAALTFGKMLLGRFRVGDRRQQSMIGPAVQQLEGLLRESSAGDFVLSRRLREAVDSELAGARVQVRVRDGLLSTQQHYLVDVEAVSRDFKPVLAVSSAAGVEGETTLQLGPDGNVSQVDSAIVPSAARLEPGTLVGDRYEILSVLGTGGMGVVYKARDRELSDLVALKALKPSLVQSSTFGTDTVALLKSELKLARKVTHPNVLRTHDFQMFDGRGFISMEYVRGITLRLLVERSGQVPRSAALLLLQQLCAGLQAAHRQGVLHGDIKPENIILEPDGQAKLMDFGIARPLAGKRSPEELVLGTPYYMAPEQILGEECDVRCDIYACGVVAYELLVGCLPFSGADAKEVFTKHLQELPPPPRERVPDLPVWLENVLLRCLAKSPAERYASASDLEDALTL